MTIRTMLSKHIEAHQRSFLASIVGLSIIVRVFVYLWLQQYQPNHLFGNSLSDGYLLPRTSQTPWQVDWSYGPLTYLLYWLFNHTSYASILVRLVNFAADAASTYLVGRISLRFTNPARSMLAAAGWAFALPVIWGSVFGQVDSLPILTTLASVYYALKGRTKPALMSVALGLVLKWYPILLLPIILRALHRKESIRTLTVYSLAPFLLYGLLIPVASSFSRISSADIIQLTWHNFSSRIPAGPSIWNLLTAILPANNTLKLATILAAYISILTILLALSLKGPIQSEFQFVSSVTLLLIGAVNIASQIEANYLLWYYPLTLIVVIRQPNVKELATRLSLIAASFILDLLFLYPRLATINRGPVALIARPDAYDITLIIAYQACAWMLFILLARTAKDAQNF